MMLEYFKIGEPKDTQTLVNRPRNLDKDRLSLHKRNTRAFAIKYLYLADACELSVGHINGLQQWLKLNLPWNWVDVLGGDVGLLGKLGIMKSKVSWNAPPHPADKKTFWVELWEQKELGKKHQQNRNSKFSQLLNAHTCGRNTGTVPPPTLESSQ